MAKSGGGVARLRCAPLVAVVQAADLWNGDHTSRIQRRDSTWKGESVTIIIEPRDGSIDFSDSTGLTHYCGPSFLSRRRDVLKRLKPGCTPGLRP